MTTLRLVPGPEALPQSTLVQGLLLMGCIWYKAGEHVIVDVAEGDHRSRVSDLARAFGYAASEPKQAELF